MALVRALLVGVVCVVVVGYLAVDVGGGAFAIATIPVTLWIAAACFAINWLAFIPSAIARSERFYDATGSVTFLAVIGLAVASVVVSGASLDPSRLVPAILVAVWALRLGSFLFRRVNQVGKDGRFDEMKQKPSRFFVPWTVQAVWVFLTSLAAVVVITNTTPQPFPSPWALAGWALWAAGFAIEVVADRQKARFRNDAGQRGTFIASGLWAWSRHPNYFGEMVLWAGLFMSGLDVYAHFQWLAVISPLFVIVLLLRVSGVPLLEKRADERWGNDAAYQAYKKRTPVLIPWPPRAPPRV